MDAFYLMPLAIVVGWVGGRLYAKYAPSERELAFKAAAAATKRLAALEQASPDALAAAAAQAKKEEVQLQAFKDAVAGLK